jgi:hypothetical protein
MGKSMPIDRVNSAPLLRGVAQPLVTARDDHLPEKFHGKKKSSTGKNLLNSTTLAREERTIE